MATPTTSVGVYIAECQRVLESMRADGIKYEMHGYGTNLEGPFHLVCKAVERCHEAVHEQGALRISSDIRLGTRIDKQAPRTKATGGGDSDGDSAKQEDWAKGLGENERKRESVRRILARDAP